MELKQPQGMMRPLLIAIIALVIIGGAVWYFTQMRGTGTEDGAEGAIETNTVETVDINDVSARVNGKAVPKEEITRLYNQISQVAQSQGADINDPTVAQAVVDQVVQTAVNTTLLSQLATSNGFTVTDEEAEIRINEIVEAGGGREVFMQQLAGVGVTEDVFNQDIRTEMAITKLIEANVDTNSIVITDAQIEQTYNNAATFNTDLPPLEEVTQEIRDQLTFEEEQRLISSYIESVRNDADIEVKS